MKSLIYFWNLCFIMGGCYGIGYSIDKTALFPLSLYFIIFPFYYAIEQLREGR